MLDLTLPRALSNEGRPIDDRASLKLLLTSHNERSRNVYEKGASLKAKECSLNATMHPYDEWFFWGIAGLEPATIRLKAQCSTN